MVLQVQEMAVVRGEAPHASSIPHCRFHGDHPRVGRWNPARDRCFLGHSNCYRIGGRAARNGAGIFDGYADAGIGLDYCGRFVDHDISSDDRYAVRLGCSNSHPLGAR
jgi:hypothetical protein